MGDTKKVSKGKKKAEKWRSNKLQDEWDTTGWVLTFKELKTGRSS
jgi:hypothetical protein